MTTIAERLVDGLVRHGARAVFGIPGDYALPLFAALERDGRLPVHCLAHEPALGFAADGAARSAGGLGVAAVTYGAGALNMVNAVAGAYAERSPLVVVSGAPGQRDWAGPLALHHQVKDAGSQLRIYREVTAAQAVLDDPATAPLLIAATLRTAAEQSRPVYLEVPRDRVDAPCGLLPPSPEAEPDGAAAGAAAQAVMALLRRARRPALMAGVEVRRYGLEDQVARLARRLGVPVVTSFMGQGVLAGRDVPVAGTYLGRAGDPFVRELVEESDGLLLLGVILCDTNFALAARPLDPARCAHALGRTVAVGGERHEGVSLAALLAALEALPAPVPAPPPRRRPPAPPSPSVAADAPLTTDGLAAALDRALAAYPGMELVSDVGDCLFAAAQMRPRPVMAPAFYAGMGFAVPAALGAQAATGRRPLVLVGDGAFQMTGMELGACAEAGWDPLVVVLNNGGWGMLKAIDPASRHVERAGWDHAAMAGALGGDGYRVATRRELDAALALALQRRGRFQLIEVMLAPGSLSSTLAAFTAGLRAAPAAAIPAREVPVPA